MTFKSIAFFLLPVLISAVIVRQSRANISFDEKKSGYQPGYNLNPVKDSLIKKGGK
jgi:hypothetical protein